MDRRVHEMGGQGASGSSDRARMGDQESGRPEEEDSDSTASQANISEEDGHAHRDLEQPDATTNTSSVRTNLDSWWGKSEDHEWLAIFVGFLSFLVLATRISLVLSKYPCQLFSRQIPLLHADNPRALQCLLTVNTVKAPTCPPQPPSIRERR
jgi:hypothetical protein